MKKDTFDISGMSCAACSASIERVLSKNPAVESVSVNLSAAKMYISYDSDRLSAEDIIAAVEKIGFGASLPLKKPADELAKRDREMRIRLIAAVLFAIPVFCIAMVPMIFPGILPGFVDPAINPRSAFIIELILTVPVLIAGSKFYTSGYKAIFSGRPNMDSLVALGTTAAIVYSLIIGFGIFSGVDRHPHFYFESAAVIIALVMIGKRLEARAKRRTGDAVRELGALVPKTALVIKDGKPEEIPVEEVRIGDRILVKPGEIIPCDAVIASGEAAIDEAIITGESVPTEKTVGDEVTQGTVNTNGSLEIVVTRIGEDTTLASIIRLVEEAGGKKAPIARLADKIASVFVPTVVSIAVISALVWYIVKGDISFSIEIFISVLVISCPCALGLATPSAITVGMGRAASGGILFKDAETLENLHKIKTVVFDKTGTLTLGRPAVKEAIGYGISENEMLSLAYSVEYRSEHPLALAISDYARTHALSLSEASSFKSETGVGVSARIGDDLVSVGKASAEENTAAAEMAEKALTVLEVRKNETLVGLIGIADEIRPDSRDAVSGLIMRGIEPIMLTGDNEKSAFATAKAVGIDRVYSSVMPSEKEGIIEKECSSAFTAMVGDGVNDSPALAGADIGIAMGSGTDIAIESADMVLTATALSGLCKAVDLSHAVIRNIKQNLFFAFCYNIIGIPIAAGVLYAFGGPMLNPMIAALAMSLSSVCVVSNALRLKAIKIKPYIK